MKKILVAIGIAVFSASISPVMAVQPQPLKVKSFAQWCQEKKTLPEKMRTTIDLLLEKTETTDCQKADRKLRSLRELDLGAPYSSNNPVIDLTPLASLTNLKILKLSFNKIDNLKPLVNLKNLTFLELVSTPISDLKPLSSLTKLIVLDLSATPISDVKPLAKLTKLRKLRLILNRISDVRPLANLTNLNELYLIGNNISDVRSLASLTKLTVLDLRSTNVNPKICPVKPVTICQFGLYF
jgi:internalin A